MSLPSSSLLLQNTRDVGRGLNKPKSGYSREYAVPVQNPPAELCQTIPTWPPALRLSPLPMLSRPMLTLWSLWTYLNPTLCQVAR